MKTVLTLVSSLTQFGSPSVLAGLALLLSAADASAAPARPDILDRHGRPLATTDGDGKRHYPSQNAWFTGYAPAQHPERTVTVLLQGAELSGSRHAAPLASEVFKVLAAK